jgi:hypothetical protein
MNNLDKQLNKITSRIDVEEFNRNAKEVFENEVVPQIKRAKEDNMTPVEWLEKIQQGQKGQPFDDYEWEISFNHAKEMEKENLESLKDFDTWKEWKNKSK